MRADTIGRVLAPDMFQTWMASHAAYPTPFRLDDRTIRIFFVSRDIDQRGHVGWCDVSATNPTQVMAISQAPVFGPGEPGAFDDSGIAIGNVVRREDGLYLYYMGWSRSVAVPFHNSIGLAVSRDGRGEKFERLFPGPILSRSRVDPFTLSYPFVMPRKSGWEMIYGTHHSATYNPMHHVFSVAESHDGVDWRPTGRNVLSPYPAESALTRPWVFARTAKQGRVLLYTSCGATYRVCMAAEGPDGRWARLHESIVSPTREAWADKDVCFAGQIEMAGGDYIFFNGNEYGSTGFGVAFLSATAE